MRHPPIRAASLALVLVLCGTAAATVDIDVYWESVTFTAEFGRAHQRAKVTATTEVRGSAVYLKQLKLAVAKVHLACPKQFIGDLPFPQLGTIHLSYSGELDQLNPNGEFEIRFLFGQPTDSGRYSEVHIKAKRGTLLGREFAVPIGTGDIQYTPEKPSLQP